MDGTTVPIDQYDYGEDNMYFTILQKIKIPVIISYFIIFILGVAGNGLVIWITGFKMKKTVDTVWFLNLAIADFAFDVLFPLQITEWIMDGHWPFGTTMCKVIFTVLFLNMSVDTSFLMIISIVRCTSVMFPVWSKNHRTLKLALKISVAVWSTCFALSSPYLAFFDIVHNPEDNITYCIPIYSKVDALEAMREKSMFFTRFVFMFLIPFSVITICYCLIMFRLKRNKRILGSSRHFKVIITIFLSFFSFWLPFHLWPFVEYMNVDLNDNVDIIISQIVYCIGFITSCVNPIVYVFAGRDFKMSLQNSIPFLLENTFRERYGTEDDTAMETELREHVP